MAGINGFHSVKIADKLYAQLEALCMATNQKIGFHFKEAIEDYLAVRGDAYYHKAEQEERARHAKRMGQISTPRKLSS